MTRAGRVVATSFCAAVMAVSSSGVAAATTSAACEGDPTGATCLMEALSACGDFIVIEGTKVEVDRYWVGCYVRAIQDSFCPPGGPCSEALGGVLVTVMDRCEESGVCDLYREAVRFVLDRVPPVACITEPVCPAP